MSPTAGPPDVEVAVVGAGPAGIAAAVTLARAGVRVAVLDKAVFPRDKTCGDGLTTGALRELEALGFDPGNVPSWRTVDRAWMASPNGRVTELPLPRDGGQFAAVARRVELDASLVGLARSVGVEVREGGAVTDVSPDADGVTLQLATGALRARAVIAADGMWSPTRRALGLAPRDYRGDWHAFRQYVGGVGPAAARDLFVWFEPDLLPGYVWSFPLGGGAANVGFGIARGASFGVGAMRELWPELLARPAVQAVLGPDAVAEGPHRAWPIPARVGELPLRGPRTLFVGDAAAACDPLTGEGIGQALATGRWAAWALLAEGVDRPDAAGTRYERVVRRELVADHAMSRLLIRAIRHRRGMRTAAWLIDRSDWTRTNFTRWLFEDYPRALVATPDRWRGRLARPGAFRSADT